MAGQSKTWRDRWDRRDGQTDRTRATTRLSRRRWKSKIDGTAVVEAKWDTNRNLTVVTHVVRCSTSINDFLTISSWTTFFIFLSSALPFRVETPAIKLSCTWSSVKWNLADWQPSHYKTIISSVIILLQPQHDVVMKDAAGFCVDCWLNEWWQW